MAELPEVERMIDDLERDAVARSQRYGAMQAEVQQIAITAAVANGAVSVTVGHNGLPTAIKMTDAVRGMNPDEIAANVMKAIQKAQSGYPERMREIIAETVGDDSISRHLVETAEASFPDAPEEELELPPEPERQLYETAEELPSKPPKPPAAPRRPTRSGGDDEDFSDQSFLRRDDS
ncbi:YbaB/EbfC family nucleoid-associated protein [Amycolatopsis sp. H20-H5]|uniref:YbaB/EbfC family nucleoid-associated protein n=1 Tax=Amycolatopsis sp. H20-H5 TaxID=3046309 RepID=UPI002DBDFA89|nr:YbaB/EbfC family nucleoid-associated protein [Amycolatopsis sp. H20-H5]MEC3977794.1 YbaB/EbfC family nucleoid-associated protein [Amycolatopsis sp. H20-H5]